MHIYAIFIRLGINYNRTANFRKGKQHLVKCQNILSKLHIELVTANFIELYTVTSTNYLGLSDIDNAKFYIEEFKRIWMPFYI